MRPCRQPGCGELLDGSTPSPYCPLHSPEREYRRRGNRSAYQTKRWRLVRKRKLAKDPLCVECGKLATEVDHIVPVEDGGSMWSEDNHQSMCQSCHGRKTRKDVARRTYA